VVTKDSTAMSSMEMKKRILFNYGL
jgi:hypothetical protein